ncbi:MAG TPA: hypothetical protein VNW71_09210 [Thermoanaerobaculia bacterium]|nr:hypothetical protein [Thermoanaerobaculia bacterium]
MSNGYEEAKGQRNVLERLGDKIPGFRGFQDRELRRDVDRMQREHLASDLGRLKAALRDKARSYTDAGKIGALSAFDRLDRQLDGLSQAVRFADYGASGLFSPVKIGDAELQRLYEFDLSVLQDVEDLEGQIAAVPEPGGEDPAKALDQVLQRSRVLEDKWKQRELVISNVVQAGGPGAGA